MHMLLLLLLLVVCTSNCFLLRNESIFVIPCVLQFDCSMWSQHPFYCGYEKYIFLFARFDSDLSISFPNALFLFVILFFCFSSYILYVYTRHCDLNSLELFSGQTTDSRTIKCCYHFATFTVYYNYNGN